MQRLVTLHDCLQAHRWSRRCRIAGGVAHAEGLQRSYATREEQRMFAGQHLEDECMHVQPHVGYQGGQETGQKVQSRTRIAPPRPQLRQLKQYMRTRVRQRSRPAAFEPLLNARRRSGRSYPPALLLAAALAMSDRMARWRPGLVTFRDVDRHARGIGHGHRPNPIAPSTSPHPPPSSQQCTGRQRQRGSSASRHRSTSASPASAPRAVATSL